MSTSPTARISGPAELLQAVPYLLGFHPRASLVLVGLADGLLVVTARLDLTDADPAVLAETVAALCRGGSTSIVGAIYADGTQGRDRSRDTVVASLVDAADAVQCRIDEVLHVADGRWWSLSCASLDCCPADGRPLPVDPSAFTAAATYAGVVALPDRSALEQVLAPSPQRLSLAAIDAAGDAARRMTCDASPGSGRSGRSSPVKRALFTAARACAVPRWGGSSDADVARFGVALTQIPLRDAVWTAIDAGRLDGRPLWRDLACRLPEPYDAAPLFLYGWTAWRAGDGASAGIAAQRAVDSDPDYSAADLLLAALSHGVDPRAMPRLRTARSA